ncbi:MAG: monovalent cation:proton antiporter-2 (CPA2) family protein [Marinifilaceae bacterium]|jgi:monovalent cation:proton antiporter-2 (CPA2) family protein|nr:monovalent cation:proton antiporter-2 (CPA2) family protein [Marinifilaceae bacterium]
MEVNFLNQAVVYLSAAVVAVPIAKKLGFGSALGYLIAGVIIGPFVLNLVGDQGQDVMHFAEFGVIMMLFLIGLELQPSLLWKLRIPILGLGGIQVICTTIVISLIIIYLIGLSWQIALAIGLTLALSSTAIVLQTLQEKSLMKTTGGQNTFSVLLFQDIAIIPILAIMPLLASETTENIIPQASSDITIGLPVYAQTIIIISVMTAIYLTGKYAIGYAFKLIAQTRLRELFTAAALLLIVGTTLLMKIVGLSPALGTFVAGVVLAQSQYRHELETNILPFKGLLLGLFFIAVGASIDFGLIFSKPIIIFGIVFGLITIKFGILFLIGKIYGMRLDNNFLFAFGLAQGGEFAFVILSQALKTGVMSTNIANPIVASVAISMALSPLLMLLNEKYIQPKYGTTEKEERENETIHEWNEVIIAGFGRYGSTIGRFLQANGTQATYLDIDPDNVDLLRKLGLKVFYGDASRQDLLAAAGAREAKIIVIAVDNPVKTIEIVNTVQKYFPHLQIMARAKTWDIYFELIEKNILKTYKEFSDTGLRIGADVLSSIGYRKNQVYRSLQKFRKHDEEFLKEIAESRHKDSDLIKQRRRIIEELELMMLDDIKNESVNKDLGWNEENIKEEFTPTIKKIREEKL